MVERVGHEDYTIFHADLKREYLRGLAAAAIVINDANYDYSSDDAETRMYNIMERLINNTEVELKDLGVKYSAILNGKNNLANQVQGFAPQGLWWNSSPSFSMKSLEELSTKIGVILPGDDKGEYLFYRKSLRNKKPQLYSTNNKNEALNQLCASGCNLIVGKTTGDNHKILYCDLYKEQARGFVEAYLLVDYAAKANFPLDADRAVEVINLLRNSVNRSRKEIGLTKLDEKMDLSHAEEGKFKSGTARQKY